MQLLPKLVEPKSLARMSAEISGEFPLKGLTRVAAHDCVTEEVKEASIEVELAFNRDEQGVFLIKGQIKGGIPVICQRCLEPFTYIIECQFCLTPVRAGQDGDKKPYDPVLLVEEHVNVSNMLEDEILLNLPYVVNHTQGVCHSRFTEKSEVEQKQSKKNPFAKLQSLRKQDKKE